MRMSKPNEKITISIIGAGERTDCYLAALNKFYSNNFEIVAVADPDVKKREFYKEKYGVKDCYLFDGYESFIKNKERLSDIAIVATLDDMHYEPAIHVIEKDYDVILEKPIGFTIEETVAIGECAKKHPNSLVAVCHVLRYTPFFKTIKNILNRKDLGNIIDIQHNENVGYFHYAHSYVRGNWRNYDVASPFIVAKCCHDMDILLYLLGGDKRCLNISSMGTLSYFTSKNYNPNTMAKRCIDCPSEQTCPFSCIRIYKVPMIATIPLDCSSPEAIQKTFSTSPYGRCVFQCDNNVADHQVAIMNFEGGITASFNVSAFTKHTTRTIKIMCEHGEIRGDGYTNTIYVYKWINSEKDVEVIKIPEEELSGGHDGGDEGFIKNFMQTYLFNEPFDSKIGVSIESHVMAFAAEQSRINNGQSIDLSQYWEEKIVNLNK